MKVRLTKDLEVAGEKYVTGSVIETDDDYAHHLISEGLGVEFVDNEEDNKHMNTEKLSFGGALKRLIDGEIKDLVLRAPSGMNETTASDGGALVDTEQAKDIYAMAWEGSVIAPKCQVIQLGAGANSVRIPYLAPGARNRTSTPRGYWLAEGDQKTPTKFTFGSHTVTLGKLVFYVPISDELLQDVPALESFVISQVRGKIGWMVDDAILNLTTATSGMLGVLTAGAASFVSTPVASANTAAFVHGLIAGIEPAYRGKAEWYMSPARYQSLVTALGHGTTASTLPLFDAAGSKLAGLKINIMSQMSTSTKDILLGDFADGYVLVQKGGLQIDRSKDVRFEYDETVLRFVLRIAGVPVIAEETLPDGSVVAAFSTYSS